MFKGIFASNLIKEFRIRKEFRRQKKLYADMANWSITIKYVVRPTFFKRKPVQRDYAFSTYRHRKMSAARHNVKLFGSRLMISMDRNPDIITY